MEYGSLEELNAALDENDKFDGAWRILGDETRPPSLEPVVWTWEEIEEMLRHAETHLQLDEAKQGVRRAVSLRNPAPEAATSWVNNISIQLVNPGEVAKAHRHTPNAFRFVIQGDPEMYTIVDGEAFPMEDRDLILTPAMEWHDHENEGSESVIWLDGLDASLLALIHAAMFEGHETEQQPVDKEPGYHKSRFGDLRPTRAGASSNGVVPPPYRYAWDDAYDALQAAAKDESAEDPYDGVALNYVNPATGDAPTFPTFTLRLQLLRPGEETGTHRHNHTEIYHVAKGSGETAVGDEVLSWEENDCFIVPPNDWHSHASDGDEAVLFVLSDAPIFEKFALHTHEAKDESA